LTIKRSVVGKTRKTIMAALEAWDACPIAYLAP
jgi:hypothetical protein